MNCSEEICLLTTFAQMAQTKRADMDEDFIKIIVLEIYEVSNITEPFRKRMHVLSSEQWKNKESTTLEDDNPVLN